MVPRVTTSDCAVPAAAGVLPVDQYVATLARKRMAAGVLFRDKADRVLLLEPSYKPNWEIPGGAVEAARSRRVLAVWQSARNPEAPSSSASSAAAALAVSIPWAFVAAPHSSAPPSPASAR